MAGSRDEPYGGIVKGGFLFVRGGSSLAYKEGIARNERSPQMIRTYFSSSVSKS